ncbi:MAG: GNAT family N-acetyltransferase [Oscillospiraceae bacterium]|nr:GNAT family N-acetyltransferase [Oscillospiraceae bacterium]
MTTIYLVRHAEAEGNLYRRIHGWYDALITDNGFRQIEALARRFADVPIDAVYSSDLYRTMTTARAVYVPKKLPLRTDPDLREIKMGDLEDVPFGQARYADPENMALFHHSDPAWRRPGGEGFQEVGERLVRSLARIVQAHPDQSLAVFSHGTAIRQAVARIRSLPPDQWRTLGHSDNTAVTKLVWDGAQFLVEYTSDASHVPDGLSTLKKQLWWRKDSKAEDVNLRYVPAGPGLWQAFSKDTLAGQLELELDREAEEQNGWITRLALEPSFTGQNLGVQLIGQAVSVYRPLGRSYLRLCIAKEQKEILGFFRAYGFYKTDECAQGGIWEKYIGYHR